MNKNLELATVLATEPMTVETNAAGLGLDPTPADALYVRNNLDAGTTAVGEWEVELAGVVDPGRVDLRAMFESLPRHDLAMVLQCAGNGRRRLAEPVPGVQWDMGGMACVDWSGVRLADIVSARGGAVDGASFVTVLGGDAPADDPARVERSVPFEAAMETALVAEGMNGGPIPDLHGGPIRFVMPGYFAVNSVKWVRRIAFTTGQSDADIQTVRYRMVPPGEESSGDHPSLWAMGPTSRVVSASVEGDSLVVEGVAFSGGDPVTGVDVTTDRENWLAATIGPDRGPYGWRRFRASVPADSTWVASRCQTAAGVQPSRSTPNRDGYAVDGWEDLAYERKG